MLGFGSGTRNIPSVAEAAKFKKAQDFLTRPSASLLIKLKAGEQMSYCQVGDSTGIPVVWFAGPNSNRFVVGLYEAVCLEMGIRLLCFDRPGRGASTALRYPKEWTFGSWARTIL